MNIETTLEDPGLAVNAEEGSEEYEPNDLCWEYINNIESVAEFTLRQMGIHEDSDLSITIVTTQRMEELHIEWMDLPGPTDVLSFPMDEMEPHNSQQGPGMVGDIVLCPDFIEPQAKENGKTIVEELCLLTVHGVLHCLGYDHRDVEEEREMFSLQDAILENWNQNKLHGKGEVKQ
jgi:probable rRNA maturation factor